MFAKISQRKYKLWIYLTTNSDFNTSGIILNASESKYKFQKTFGQIYR